MDSTEGLTITQLNITQLERQLEVAGLKEEGPVVEKEAVLRLTTFLIDKGEDPTSYKFTVGSEEINFKEERKEEVSKMERRRQRLMAKIVMLERNYFTEGGA